MSAWSELSARASLASHRLVGWMYWDTAAIERYSALGVPEGRGWYVASRAAPLAAAGSDVVTAAFYSIHPVFIDFSLQVAAAHTTFEQIYEVRNDAVEEGLALHAPGLSETLAPMAEPLWDAADSLPLAARPLFAAHRGWPRHPERPALSAWLAVNAIREWRGDTHWAMLAAEDLSGTEAGLLHDAYLGYPGDWIPRSRGSDDAALDEGWLRLTRRGLATDGRVNGTGLELRERIEARTDELCERAWRRLGEERTRAFIDAVAPHEAALLARIDATAGPMWMPAARDRRIS
jgi:hypothetical protein